MAIRTAEAKVVVRDGDDLRHVMYDDLPEGAVIEGISMPPKDDGKEGVYWPSFHYRFTKPRLEDAVTPDGRPTTGHMLWGPFEFPHPEMRVHLIDAGKWDGRLERWPYCIPLRVEATEEWLDEGTMALLKGGDEGNMRVASNILPRHLTNCPDAQVEPGKQPWQ